MAGHGVPHRAGGRAHPPLRLLHAPCLNLSWAADGDRLYLLDGDGALTGREVTEICGLRVAEVFAGIDRWLPAENQAGRDRNHAQYAGVRDLLLQLGGEFRGDGGPVVVDGAEGTDKVIIDVRDNRGGDSSTCKALLHAMGMRAPGYGGCIRFSPLADGQRGYGRDSGYVRADPNPGAARANPAVSLAVPTNENTFSSATMLAVFVRDGGLGAVIGRPSANAPNRYGDILSFELEHTGLSGSISHRRWLRPDQDAERDAVTPDLPTAVGEDALQRALAWLQEK